MKRILKVNNTPPATDLALLIARVGIATLMFTHGIPKLMSLFSGEPVQFASVMGMSPTVSLVLAVFAEVLCSIFILIGFGTRFATIPLIVTMLVAVFMIHGADPFNVKERGLMYLLSFVVLLFTGAGKYSLDYLIFQSGKTTKRFSSHTIPEPAYAVVK